MRRARRGPTTRLLLALLLLLSIPAGAAGATRTVTFRASDGTPLSAILYEPDRRPAPAVVLVHMLTRSRADWDGVARGLRDAGLFALALDLRGHGASGGTIESTADLRPLLLDVRAAIAVLKGTDQVLAGRIGLLGASVGANLAVLAASEDPAIASLALLSAVTDYRGLRSEAHLRKVQRPVLLVAGSNDPFALRSARVLADTGTAREVEVLDAAGHGSVMLDRHPQLAARLVDWFKGTLL